MLREGLLHEKFEFSRLEHSKTLSYFAYEAKVCKFIYSDCLKYGGYKSNIGLSAMLISPKILVVLRSNDCKEI